MRGRALEVLREEPDLDAAALAQRLELHVNTVRSHLGVLEDAGLVEPSTEQRDRPGRPRRLYRAVPGAERPADGDGEEGYRFLATILASYLGSTSADPGTEAERAGRAWGAFVTDRPAPFARPSPEEVVGQLTGMMERFGFAPAVDDVDPAEPQLVLRRCPFLEVAREHQEVVCSIHLGLMRGALEELGADVEVQDLVPWGRPEGCVSHLRVGADGR